MEERKTKIIKYVSVFLILIISYMVLGTLTSLIPSNAMKNNVIKSSELLRENGDKKLYSTGYKKEMLFFYTDAIMINTAYSIDNTKPLTSFLLARKNYIPGKTKIENIDTQYDLKGNKNYASGEKDFSTTKELYGLMHDEKIEDSYEYARYWHGYLLVIRPLLVLFDLSVIRIIQIVIMEGLVLAMLFLIYKKIDLLTAIVFLFSLLSISIFVVANSINESLIFMFSFIMNIIILTQKDKIKDISLFFFIIGSITNFIDLFTVPLISFGLTATTYFLLMQKEEREFKITDYIKEFLKIGLAWGIGFGLTWIAKWIIVEVGLHRNIIEQAIKQAKYRATSPKDWTTKRSTAIIILRIIGSNIIYLSENIILLLVVLVTIYIIEEQIRTRKKHINYKENLKDSLPFIFLFLSPIAWYIVVKQHSGTHHFLTNRLLSISIINMFIIIKTMFKVKKEKIEVKNNKENKVKK